MKSYLFLLFKKNIKIYFKENCGRFDQMYHAYGYIFFQTTQIPNGRHEFRPNGIPRKTFDSGERMCLGGVRAGALGEGKRKRVPK